MACRATWERERKEGKEREKMMVWWGLVDGGDVDLGWQQASGSLAAVAQQELVGRGEVLYGAR